MRIFHSKGWAEKVIATIIALLLLMTVFSIFFPFYGHRNVSGARRISCANNLKQIGVGLMQYAQEYDERLPPLESRTRDGKIVTWRNALKPYQPDVSVWKCPSNDASKMNALDGLPMGYETTDIGPIRRNAFAIERIPAPSLTIMAFEENAIDDSAKNNGVSWNKDDGSDASLNVLFAGHLATGNFLFADGHVKSLKPIRTIENNVNMWHVDTTAKVSPRAMSKLKAAKKTFE